MSIASSAVRRIAEETMAARPANVRRAGIDRWRFEEDWLVLEIVRGGDLPRGDAAWDLLGRNAGMPGLVKFAWDSRAAQSLLRAEIPLAGADAAADAAAARESILEALADLAAAREIARSRGARAGSHEPAPLPSLLDDAGWPFAERADGTFVVEMEGPVPSPRAGIASTPSGGVRAGFEAASIASPPAPCRAAVGALLLCAGGALRMARPFASQKEDRWSVGFEVVLGPALLRGSVLREAFSSLSIASRLWTREVRGLCDPLLAEQVVAIRGWSDPTRGSAATIPALSKGGEPNGIE